MLTFVYFWGISMANDIINYIFITHYENDIFIKQTGKSDCAAI